MMIISAAFLGKNPFGFRKFSENDWKVHVVPKAWKILQLICVYIFVNLKYLFSNYLIYDE